MQSDPVQEGDGAAIEMPKESIQSLLEARDAEMECVASTMADDASPAIPSASSSTSRPEAQGTPASENGRTASAEELLRAANSRLGILTVGKVKRAGVVCHHCGCPVPKGSVKFEFCYKHNKPHKTIHTRCLIQMNPLAAKNSIRNLTDIVGRRFGPSDEELAECQAALDLLRGLHLVDS